MNLKLLEELCRANGVSGDESRVRALIRQKIEGHYESCTEDALGNLLVFKKGRQTPPRKLLFSAHMDEVGLMVSHITDEGLLRFVKVGGIDDRVLPGRQVAVGYDAIPGVIGAKAIHQLDADERGKAISWEKLTIDLGCTTIGGDQLTIMVGGAPITDAFCEKIGADIYTPDASQASDAALKVLEA